jgi:hypothetical protein
MPENEELLNEDSLFDNAVEGTETETTPEPAPVEQPAPPEPEKVAEAAPETDDVEDDGSPVQRAVQGRLKAKRAADRYDILKQERDRLVQDSGVSARMVSQRSHLATAAEEPDPGLIPQLPGIHGTAFQERLIMNAGNESADGSPSLQGGV